jgi:uncharacterized repeat protein (TIGR01451 family)
MSKTFLKTSFGVLIAAVLAWPAVAAPPSTKVVPGHVPSVVSHLKSLGRMKATNEMRISLSLPLRNTNEIDALIKQLTDPASPSYRQWLTTDQFATQFGATDQDLQSVLDFAKSNHLRVSATHGNHMTVELSGRASDVEQAFNITLETFQHPTENRTFFSPTTEPTVPVALSVNHIGGLNNYYRPHPKLMKPVAVKNSGAVGYKGGTGPGGTFIGYDYRNAYVPGTTLTGAGQKVALFSLDGYFPSDIDAYVQKSGLPPVQITNVLINGFDGLPTGSGGEGEVTLDIDMIISMAPNIHIINYEMDPNAFDQNVILSRIASDNAAPVVSCSWGWIGGPQPATDQIFQEMILQGQCFFNATGDKDAFMPPGTPPGTGSGAVDDPSVANAPSSNPFIVQVGGTQLTTDSAGNFVSESVWNERKPNQSGGEWGSSGGISGYYAIPSWQRGISMVANNGSSTMRNVPDVAFIAQNVYTVLYGADSPTAGTSCAAPLWAGFAALINQQAAVNNQSSLGFLNPALYALAKSTNYNNCFHDVTTGDNTWALSPTNFFAVTGYDLATGWGSPNGTNLIFALLNASGGGGGGGGGTIITAPTSWGTNLTALNGSNPNGAWFLFVQDDQALNSGNIANGWSVTLTTANPVGGAADNAVSVAPTNNTLVSGSQWTITLAVTNYGPSTSSNVFVSDQLPVGMTLVSNTPSMGSTVVSGPLLTWNLGTLPINAGATLTLNFLANATGQFVNSATVNALTGDPNPDDDTAVATVSVQAANPPHLTAGFLPGGAFQLSVTGDPVLTSVQASTNLVNWTSLYSAVPPFVYTDNTATNYPKRFYRAQVGP